MKTLLLLRHGAAGWQDASVADHDRPLNQKGEADARRVGQLLRRTELHPDLILGSSAVRARSTVDALVAAAGFTGPVQLTRRLYTADADDHVLLLRETAEPAKRVLIVAHNPSLEDLVKELTGHGAGFPPAGLAWVSVPVFTWMELNSRTGCTLEAFWRPQDLEDVTPAG